MLDEVPTRRCSRCKVEKLLTREFFWKSSDPKNRGFIHQCVDCARNRVEISKSPLPETRRCNRCQMVKPLTLEFFFADLKRGNGFAYGCKECFKKHRQNPEWIKHRKRKVEIRYKSNPEFYLKIRANQCVAVQVKKGKLHRTPYCQLCLVGCKPYGHHYLGYRHPNWLDVVWLCRRCHEDIHHQPAMPPLTP